MVFSLFGKKPEPPEKPAAKKPPAPAAPARPAAMSPPEPKEELGDLDFTAPGALEGREEDPHGTVELRESSTALPPVVEEAAILFANGQDEAALAALEAAADDLGDAAAELVWAMLFDLYQLMGRREAFEKRALDYSVKYEKSPPTWTEPAQHSLGPALTTGGTAFVAFSGLLGENAEKSVRQLEKIVTGSAAARVDFARVRDVDAHGAALLLAAMRAARKARCELVTSGAERLVTLLQGKIEVGRRENESLWLLLLELYQHMGRQEPFEEWAVNYAVTFEVSPPSWENRVPSATPAPPPAAPAAADPEVFTLTGEMYSAGSDAFRRLIDFAAGRSQVVVDCSTLRRMDFVSAGLFLNTLTNLQITGTSVSIRHPNHLLYALFVVLGIPQVAHVERRKF